MSKLKKTLYLTLIASETSHVFCCVLPTIFSVLSLLAGLGLVGAMPLWLEDLHALMHNWEVPIILFSGVVILIGWCIHLYSNKIDCHDHGCSHGPCEPTKDKSILILKIATILFLVNIIVYGVFHRGMNIFMPENSIEISHENHHHDGHGHDH